MADRLRTAVEYRQALRRELSAVLSSIRPDQINAMSLIELNDLLSTLRPVLARAEAPPGVASPAMATTAPH